MRVTLSWVVAIDKVSCFGRLLQPSMLASGLLTRAHHRYVPTPCIVNSGSCVTLHGMNISMPVLEHSIGNSVIFLMFSEKMSL